MKKRQKIIRRIIVILMLLSLLLGLLPAVFADGEPNTEDERFAGKTWEEIIADYFDKHGLDRNTDNVTLGYYNTVTGEEYYYLPDQYMNAGSMYKIPLNMCFAEKVFNGEITMDTVYGGLSYEDLQKGTIVYSNNDYAKILWDQFGYTDGNTPYRNYRRAIAPLMGEDPDNVDDKFYENNYATARQQMTCLKTLYAEPDRYPGVIDCMLKAERSRWMMYHEQSVDVAHKYGYANDDHDYLLYINDCAICYTTEPIIIVMYSRGLGTENAHQHCLADYCTLMIDYAEYKTAADAKAKAEATPEPTAEPEPTPVAEPAPAPAVTPVPEATPATVIEESNNKASGQEKYLAALTLIITLFALSIMLLNRKKLRFKVLPATLSILFAAAAFLTFIYGAAAGEAKLDPEGDPAEAVHGFFDNITSGNYSEACKYLNGYSDIGLDYQSDDSQARVFYDALIASYAVSYNDEPVINNTKAVQYVDFTYLNLKAFSEGLQAETDAVLEEMVKASDNPNAMYDENDNYLPEVTESAYTEALNRHIQSVGSYYETKHLSVNTEYDYNTGKWLIAADNELFNVLSGNMAY